MRDDATLWVNLGSSYAGSGGPGSQYDNKATRGNKGEFQKFQNVNKNVPSFKPLDLIGIPWMFAFAMQRNGWYLRSAITWCKHNVMPESVNGWRWEQHRVKVEKQPSGDDNKIGTLGQGDVGSFNSDEGRAPWSDCPGCANCLPNGGLILRKGNWRPTKATEMIFMFSKTDSYYSDKEAVLVPLAESSITRNQSGWDGNEDRDYMVGKQNNMSRWLGSDDCKNQTGRNLWDYWLMSTKPLHESHFAAYPPELVKKCVLASTSAKGVCPKCGGQWARVLNKTGEKICAPDAYGRPRVYQSSGNSEQQKGGGKGSMGFFTNVTEMSGWRPTCRCPAADPIPAVVLDPFVGSGTTCIVAAGLGRNSIGIDASAEYIAMSHRRLGLLVEEEKSKS